MNEKEAELIGMHVGDGTLYTTNTNSLVWEMRGSINEKEYYECVSNLIREVLNVEVKPKFRGPNSYGIQTTNKTITKFFMNNGFKPGSKVYTVSIPNYIKEGDKSIKLSFLRGLFDTDGCVWFCKNRTLYRYYPKIEFGFASEKLSEDLFSLFGELGLKAHRWKNIGKDGVAFKLCLAGFANLKIWLNDVRPSNQKHLKRCQMGLNNKDKVNLKKVSTNL